MAQEKGTQENISIDSENIFDEFTDSEGIKNEIARTEKLQHKDIYYYMKKVGTLFFTINITVFIVLLVGSFYIYIQERETKTEYGFLSSVCNLFLGTNNITPGTCYGVAPILREYEALLSKKVVDQSIELFPILGGIYSIENFNLSKKVSFLLEKDAFRLKPLEILVAFDELKNIFSPTDKEEISCYSIYIVDNTLNITCDAFSSDWNTDIITLNKGNIEILPGWGTSISRASSFIYFIENYRESSFSIILKPEAFTSVGVQLGPYTKKTTFSLELQYDPKENLTF
jgi:hypothetical protein